MNIKNIQNKINSILDKIGDKLDGINIFKISIIGSIIFTCIIVFQKCSIDSKDSEILNQKETISSMYDTITRWKDKSGKQHLKIVSLVNTNTDNILEIKSNREDIKHLQEVINDYRKDLNRPGSSVTVSKPVTNFDTVLKTEIKNAEKILDSTVLEQNIKTKWVDANFGFSKDSTWLKFKTFDKVSILNRFDRKNIFSKYQLNTELIHENPHVEYEYLRGWNNVSVPNNKWILGPTIVTGFDKNLKFTWIIGVGITYKIIAF